MKYVWIITGAIVFLFALAYLPAVLAKFLDPRNIRIIRRRCSELGLSEVSIKSWPNHYGVHYTHDGEKHYARCLVKRGAVHWISHNPEAAHANAE